MSKNIIFITETLFKERTGASTAIDGKQIFPMVKVAQDIYIQPALGSELYKRIQDGIDNDDLNNDEKELLDNYITDALVWFTMSLLPMTMGYQLFSKGFLQKTSEESTPPSQKDLELIEQKYLAYAEYYKTRIIKYLKQNYTKYLEYLNTPYAYDSIFPENKAYTCPIYLGDQREPRYFNNTSAQLTLNVYNYNSVGGESQFTINELIGRQILVASRGGLTKLIITTTTNDTGYLTINNGLIQLPIGDLTEAGELFTFLYK
jgi:hypothetical protein